ncbi:MAG: Crp/Fnr family transcriptional regulator [Pseudomonadota bacterium]
MQFIPTQKRPSPEQRRLLELFDSLDEQNRLSLLAFAEFLANRDHEVVISDPKDDKPLEPKLIPRPATESVVKAIKRLSASYFMLERDKMLDETSSLMTAHVMHGRDAVSVINDLERLFERHYQRYLDMD